MFVTKKKFNELKKDMSRVVKINAEIIADNFILRSKLKEFESSVKPAKKIAKKTTTKKATK